jgi:hypothetical protein
MVRRFISGTLAVALAAAGGAWLHYVLQFVDLGRGKASYMALAPGATMVVMGLLWLGADLFERGPDPDG